MKKKDSSLSRKAKLISLAILLMFLSQSNCYSQFNFSVEGPIAITSSAYDITIGNFDNAGRLDAIVSHAQNYNNTTPSNLNIVSYIKYNTSSSIWESQIIENTGGYASLSVTSGDYDSDGNRDFAFTSNCNCGNYYLYKGDGAGGFTNSTPTFSGNRFSYDMVTGELNNDGKPDILTGGNTMLSRFLNTSTGIDNFSFTKIAFIIPSSDNSSYGYSIADFDGDGFNDIVAAVPAEAKVRVFLNDGAGGFNSSVYDDYSITATSTSNIRGVATGDFNDDGYPDIVAASYNGNAIGVLINSADGTGTFDPVVLYSVTTPRWVEIGDLNNDGFLDVVVAANNISIFSGNGDGTFAVTPFGYNLSGVNRLKVADIDNDGKDDIAVLTSSTFRVLINGVADNDGDGYDESVDCDDNNSAINPGAIEVCDGVDNDCDGLIDSDDPDFIDNINPVALCQDVTVQLDETGNGSTTADAVNNSSSDACGIQSLSLSQTDFDCSEVGANTVTLTVTDNNSNTSTCSATVTVEDNIAPLLSIQDITVYLDREGGASITKTDLVTATSDNCAVLDTAISVSTFGCSNTGDNEVIVTLRDVNGNQTEETAIVTVLDEIFPVAVCKDVTLFLDETGHAPLTGEEVNGGSRDNCGFSGFDVDIADFDCNDLGENTVVLTVTDNSGNTASCQAQVMVVDTQVPQIDTIPDVEVVVAAGVCETAIDYPHPYVYDNCEITLELLSGLGENGVFPVGSTTETWVATDKWDNSDTLSFNVTVTAPNAAPAIGTIADVTVDEGSTPVTVDLTGISWGIDCNAQEVTVTAESSNAGLASVTVSYTEGETGSLELSITPEMTGEAEITVTVTDSEGATATATFKVVVTAVNHAPVLVTPIADQTVNASYVLKVPVPAEMFADADGDELQVEVMQAGGENLPEWGIFANDTLVFNPMIADTGCYHMVVKATDPEGTFATDTFQVCVEGYPVSAGEIAAGGFGVNMYPNPTRGEVTIGISSGFHNVELTVSDIAGRAVLRKQYSMVERITFDMSDKVSGMYLITLDIDGERTVKKLVVDRK